MGGTVTLFRIRGIPVRVHASWLVIYGLIAWSLAVGYFPQVLPAATPVTSWVSALLAALLLFVSVFLHELSHALVALRHGIPVSSITLHVFGGVSALQHEPDRPGAEIVIAVVGPLTSFAIAGVVAVLAALLQPGGTAAAVMQYLVLVNVVVGLFNLVPGFPLDGGRVLRALLWKARGDLGWATRVASRTGEQFGLVLIALGTWRAVAGQFLGGLWFVVIGLFLRQAAVASYQQLVVRRSLEPRKIRDAMARHVVHVPPDLPVAALVDDFFWRHHVSSFPVVDGGRVMGIVGIHDLGAVPRDRWPATTVGEVMRPLTEALVARPDDSLLQAFEKVSRNGIGRLAIVEGEHLVGYLSVKDVMHVLAVTSAAADGEAGASRRSPPSRPSSRTVTRLRD
jgi:Zn-dependent protease/predicted transcriptional regulator